jgi:hypothetical protein
VRDDNFDDLPVDLAADLAETAMAYMRRTGCGWNEAAKYARSASGRTEGLVRYAKETEERERRDGRSPADSPAVEMAMARLRKKPEKGWEAARKWAQKKCRQDPRLRRYARDLDDEDPIRYDDEPTSPGGAQYGGRREPPNDWTRDVPDADLSALAERVLDILVDYPGTGRTDRELCLDLEREGVQAQRGDVRAALAKLKGKVTERSGRYFAAVKRSTGHGAGANRAGMLPTELRHPYVPGMPA